LFMKVNIKKKKQKFSAGFTLIELLVVIAIIGLLATIVMVSLNSARGKARDSRSLADFRQIYSAMALYYEDASAYYATGDVDCNAAGEGTAISAGVSIGDYIAVVPQSNGTEVYSWCNGGATGIQDTQKFCIYVQSAVNTSNYFYVSEKGIGVTTSALCP